MTEGDQCRRHKLGGCPTFHIDHGKCGVDLPVVELGADREYVLHAALPFLHVILQHALLSCNLPDPREVHPSQVLDVDRVAL